MSEIFQRSERQSFKNSRKINIKDVVYLLATPYQKTSTCVTWRKPWQIPKILLKLVEILRYPQTLSVNQTCSRKRTGKHIMMMRIWKINFWMTTQIRRRRKWRWKWLCWQKNSHEETIHVMAIAIKYVKQQGESIVSDVFQKFTESKTIAKWIFIAISKIHERNSLLN